MASRSLKFIGKSPNSYIGSAMCWAAFIANRTPFAAPASDLRRSGPEAVSGPDRPASPEMDFRRAVLATTGDPTGSAAFREFHLT